jgi:predicted nuclease of predicted toxin-antitoxin system
LPNNAKKVKFLADECTGLPTIRLLRELGYLVITAEEANLSGKSDIEILKYAVKEKMILITEDTDFGNILLYPPKFHHGIVLLRFRHRLEEEIHAVLSNLLTELKPKDFTKSLIIVDAEKYRVRKE